MTARGAFRALAATQALSMLGSRMSGVAVGFAVYASGGRAAPLLLYSFFSELPAMLLGTLAGALVDRRDARRTALLADAGQALGSLLLALAFLSGAFRPWMLYAVGLWMGSCAAFQGPAKDLLTARLVPDEGRDRANALLSMSHPAAGILAPGLAGALYPLVGVGGIVLLDLLSFLAAALALALIPLRAGAGAAGPREGLLADLRGAAAFLRRKPALAGLILYAALANFLLNGPLELALPLALERTGRAGLAGLALSLQGAGGLAGSAFLALRGRIRSRLASIVLGLSGAGLLMLALALSRDWLALGLSLFGLVACLQVWSRFTSIYQAEVPLGLQGRITAFAGQLGFLGSTASFALAGFLADRLLEPAARAGWGGSARFVSAFGAERGGGMALLIAAAGLCLLLLTLALPLIPGLRGLGRAGGLPGDHEEVRE